MNNFVGNKITNKQFGEVVLLNLQEKRMKNSPFALLLLLITTIAFGQKITPEEYIERYKIIAIAEMKQYGIPASITLAQGCLESNFGNSMLAKKANNHFGIKCHSSWTGKKIYKDDDKKHECFRRYKSAWESFRDHSEFLRTQSRYAFLFEYKITDYKKWAYGLKKAGYATSPSYPKRLINIIEKYNLSQYDNKYQQDILADNRKHNKEKTKKRKNKKRKTTSYNDNFSFNPFGREIKTNNRVKYLIAKKNDTYYKIAEEMEMMKWEIFKYNDLQKNASITAGQIIYLQPKRNKAERGCEKYVVKRGDSLYSISQKFAIKLKSLRKKNNLSSTDNIKPGDILWLRKRKLAK
ncbi:MAG TPA: LysM peptidoglycan-binding domain-containing protein [Bacteroidales bacterium]|nr:LysM peptidoglycan-binding domain-containing protein [Bacteroidales bacterium]